MIASLIALVLAAADGPISTSPDLRPSASDVPAPAAPPTAQPVAPDRDPEIPSSAPTDDYGFVAWCHGALTGHMELHDRVKPELDKVSPGADDSALMKAGEEYLSLYSDALKAAEKASPTNIHDRGAAADAAGYRIWAAARAAEPRTQMWSYLMWELPPRCETVAKKLEERSSLFGEALKPAPNPPAPAGSPAAGPPAPEPSTEPAAEAAPPTDAGAELRGPQ